MSPELLVALREYQLTYAAIEGESKGCRRRLAEAADKYGFVPASVDAEVEKRTRAMVKRLTLAQEKVLRAIREAPTVGSLPW